MDGGLSPSRSMRTIADANCENNFVIGGDHYYDGDNDYHDGDGTMRW